MLGSPSVICIVVTSAFTPPRVTSRRPSWDPFDPDVGAIGEYHRPWSRVLAVLGVGGVFLRRAEREQCPRVEAVVDRLADKLMLFAPHQSRHGFSPQSRTARCPIHRSLGALIPSENHAHPRNRCLTCGFALGRLHSCVASGSSSWSSGIGSPITHRPGLPALVLEVADVAVVGGPAQPPAAVDLSSDSFLATAGP